MIELGTGIVERVPMWPSLDLVKKCRSWTLSLPDLAVTQKLVLSRYGTALHPTLDERFSCSQHLRCRELSWLKGKLHQNNILRGMLP